jgi:hypothetical protein
MGNEEEKAKELIYKYYNLRGLLSSIGMQEQAQIALAYLGGPLMSALDKLVDENQRLRQDIQTMRNDIYRLTSYQQKMRQLSNEWSF